MLLPPPDHLVRDAVNAALAEDLGLAGDITSEAIFDKTTIGSAVIRARETGILAGAPFAEKAFQTIDKTSQITWHLTDGAPLKAGDLIATITAPVIAILTAERTALNFLGLLSGIASLTNSYVQKTKGTKAEIADTRKTTPSLRFAEKYAVRAGGGKNHRFRLDDAIMIKDNHIAFAGSIKTAIEKTRTAIGHMVKIEVEVDTLEQLKQCLAFPIDAVLLDNMSIKDLRSAVELIDGKLIAEASGGVNLDTVEEIAKTGVDIISVGALTHSAKCLDLGLDIDIA